MKKILLYSLMLCLTLTFLGCGTEKQIIRDMQVIPQITKQAPPSPEEKLLWASHEKRPEWTVNEPRVEGVNLFFVGVSGNYTMENDARDDAYKNAVKGVINYIGIAAKDHFERLLASFGVSSQTVDPTKVSKEVEAQISGGIARKAKANGWYIEKWQDSFGKIYWKGYVLVEVPTTSIDQSYKKVADAEQKAAQQEYEKTKDQFAKDQLEKVMKAFEEAKQKGFTAD
ncbi:MAG: hypothetical protein ABH886_02300 [Candidatus Desantisbacteria bacterium]